MNKEGEYRNFEEEPKYDFKYDWAVGREFEHWMSVDGGKLRIRTEITYFKTPPEGGEENNSSVQKQV